MSKYKLAIDIGGTKVQANLYSEDLSTISWQERYMSDDTLLGNGEAGIESLFETIAGAVPVEASCVSRVGVSINCAIHQGRVIKSNLLGESALGLDLPDLSCRYFPTAYSTAINDVTAMAKAEKEFGVGKRETDFLLVNLGTGIRFAAVANGVILQGYRSQAGEISVLSREVPEGSGIVSMDKFAAGRAFEHLTSQLYGETLTAEEVFSRHGEFPNIIDTYCQRLGGLLWEASCYYNPASIVFAGSIAKSADVWLPRVQDFYSSQKYDFIGAKELVVSELDYPACLGTLID